MIRRWLVACGLAVAMVCVVTAQPASAASLEITPLRYDAKLAAGEKKKGFVDITNPGSAAMTVKLSVEAFRQTDNNGSLEFYHDELIQGGVLLDYDEVDLGPKETLHLAFVLDGAKLRTGDNFAAIFATSVPSEHGAGEQTIRVGTILIIQNGTPSTHTAAVEDLSSDFIQLSDGLRAVFSVRNTADAQAATGFSPAITVSAWPYFSETVTGPLVFAGKSRQVDYQKKGNFLGVLAVRVKTGDSEQVAYSLLITGFWRALVPILLFATGLAIWLARYVRKNSR